MPESTSIKASLDRAVETLQGHFSRTPGVGVILGSGLGGFAACLAEVETIPYSEIPGFPRPEAFVRGHRGKLYLGKLGGHQVAVLSGRFHLYEGLSFDEVAHPVRVLAHWGVRTLVVTNAAGAVNHAFTPGDLMVIRDHINGLGGSPLVGTLTEELGSRFVDMGNAYSPRLRVGLRRAAEKLGLTIREGVYCAIPGPQYETPAEVHMLGILGVDAVGMSTVPEVIAARHLGIEVVGISHITNMAAGLTEEPLSHTEVLKGGARSAGKLGALVYTFLEDLPPDVE